MDERKLTIDWVGTEGSVKGNVAFTTDRNANIVLTADEINALYTASAKARDIQSEEFTSFVEKIVKGMED